MKRSLILSLLMLVASFTHAQSIDLRLTAQFAGSQVVEIKHAGDGSNRLFLVQQNGEIRIVRNGEVLAEPFLSLLGQVSRGSEQGLLSLAFAPDFASSGRLYIYYTDTNGRSVIARYRAEGDSVDPDSEQIILTQSQFAANHNGGRLEFGSDGMLYFGFGDGGGGGDPQQTSQDGGTLLGKLIRIDVSGDDAGYAIPADNPFVNVSGTRGEVWALGLRNPWRMAFDRATGDLYVADVGQNNLEEVNFQPAGQGGLNYGWSIFEGSSCFGAQSDCDQASGLTAPIFEYGRGDGCSITGGQVYRGQDYPALDGMYLFGDFCTGQIWGTRRTDSGFATELLLDSTVTITTFGEDEMGNVYVAGSGQIFLLSDGEPAARSRPIVGQHSGSYVVANMPDQGFLVNIGNDSNPDPFLFFAWFTYRNGEPFWLVGIGRFREGDATVSMTVESLDGPGFLDFSNTAATRTNFGTMTFTARDCGTFDVGYDFGTNGAGDFELNRLTNTLGHICTE